MAQTTMTQKILQAIGKTISPVVEKYYYFTRPNATSEDMKHFAVIALPTPFRRNLTGYGRNQTQTTGIVYVFSKAKTNNTPNIGDLTEISEKVEELFPVTGDGFCCTNTDIQYMGADDYGYQMSRISFDIFIKKV